MLAPFVLIAAVTATFSPARPTVGDLVTIEFAQPARLDPSPRYEIVSQSGKRVVLRTFEPHPLVLSGVTGPTRFANLVLPVQSVLTPGDDLAPAPLKPPRAAPVPRRPFVAIAIAAAAAAIAWIAVLIAARRARPVPLAVVPPADEFRRVVAELRRSPYAPGRWAALADATRRYLSHRGYGIELTTTQVMGRLWSADVPVGDAVAAPTRTSAVHELIEKILRYGDLEKFSPWGPPQADFRDIAACALDLPAYFEPPPAEEEKAA